MAGDKPKNIISVADLDDIAENPDPITIALKDGTKITFPDVYDMPLEEAEAFFRELTRGMNTGIMTPALKTWLSEEDYKALTKASPTVRRLGPVIERVMAEYEARCGTEAAGRAPTS